MQEFHKTQIQAALKRYAWPGGYPLYLVTYDGGALCPSCVKSEIREIVGACGRWPHTEQGGVPSDIAQWLPLGCDVNWENPSLYCDHCGERIESAYAEDEQCDATE